MLIEVQINGKTYPLSLSVAGLRDLCKRHGPIVGWNVYNVDFLCALLAVGIAHVKPKATPEWVADNLEPAQLFAVAAQAQKAVNHALGITAETTNGTQTEDPATETGGTPSPEGSTAG